METSEILKELREKHKLTQEELAERVLVTRQAVRRWETGETMPNTETLKLLSREYDVSINTLLGSLRKLYCQCCGMPLNEDGMISREPSGRIPEAAGQFYRKNTPEQTDYGLRRNRQVLCLSAFWDKRFGQISFLDGPAQQPKGSGKERRE